MENNLISWFIKDSLFNLFKVFLINFLLDDNRQQENLNLQIAYYTLLVTIAKTDTEAKNFADTAIELDLTNYDPFMALGVRYFEQDEEMKALEIFRIVAQKEPQHPYAK